MLFSSPGPGETPDIFSVDGSTAVHARAGPRDVIRLTAQGMAPPSEVTRVDAKGLQKYDAALTDFIAGTERMISIG